MKKLISILLALTTVLSTLFAGTVSAFAATPVNEECTKILLVGNSYTYYNGLDQILCKLGDAAEKDLLVVSAVKGSCDANDLLSESLSYYAWYDGNRIETGSGSLNTIAKKDIGNISRGGSWDYVYLQNNADAYSTGMGDVRMVSFFTDMLELNKNFIINSNYWVESLKKDRFTEHYSVAKATGSSLIDTRGIFAQYLNVFKDRVWFKDLTIRDSRNHPSVWGTYLFALSIYAKIFGIDEFPSSVDDNTVIPLYNTENGNIKEIFDVSKFKNSYTLNESINRETAIKLQYLVSKYADEYIGDSIVETTSGENPNLRPSLPKSSIAEAQRYYDGSGNPRTGWSKLSGYDYYLDNGYISNDGFKKINGSSFYFDEYGEVLTGWNTISKKKYYFSKGNDGREKGTMYTGFNILSNKTYYFSGTGVLQKKKFVTVDSKKYYANSSGVIQKNKFLTISNKRYFFDEEGVMAKAQFITYKNKKYYATKKGYLKTGWLKKGGKYYYFAKTASSKFPKYSMYTGKHKIGGKKYKFTKAGVCKNRK